MDMENFDDLYKDRLAFPQGVGNPNHLYNDGSQSGAGPVNSIHPCNDGLASREWIGNPSRTDFPPHGEHFPVHNNGSGSELRCTSEQLDRAGYKRPPPIPDYPRDPQGNLPDPHPTQERKKAPLQTYTQNITIRCLEPPIIEGARTLTIIEKRPPAPPAPPPLHICKHERPPPVPPLILREEPPPQPKPPSDETCYVMLDRPPIPPRQVITHICQYPPKPADIIIEKWLPYKRLHPQKIKVVPAPPFIPIQQKNLIIIYEPVPPHNKYEVICEDHIKRLTNPEDYRQQHGGTLLPKAELERILEGELNKQRASQEDINKVNHYLRNCCVAGVNPCGSIMPIPNIQRTIETNLANMH